MTIEELNHLLQLSGQAAGDKDQQIQLLKKQRYQLLDDIHQRQQLLDRLDYLIQIMKQSERPF